MSDDLLRSGKLLDDLLGTNTEPESREVLVASLRPVEGKAGTVFLEEAKPNDRLWFLIEGEAAVERQKSGSTIPIATLSAPAIFGATTFFRLSTATATIKAKTDCRVMTLDHGAYELIRTNNPKAAELLALAALRVLSERFDLIDQRFTEFLHQQSVEQNKANEWTRFRTRLFERPNII